MRSRPRPTSLRETVPGFRRILRGFAPYLRQHRMMLAGGAGALFAATATRLMEPWPLKFIIDRVVTSPAGGGSGIALADGLDTMTLLTLASAAVVVIIALKAAATYLSTIAFAMVGSRVLTEVRNDLFRHVQRLSLGFHTKAKAGDLTIRLIGDVGMLKETTVTAILPLAANILVLAGMVGVMLWLNWQLALLAFLPLPLLWFSTVRASRRIQDVSRNQRKREGEMAATAAESITAMRVVQSLSLEKRIASSFIGQSAKDLKAGVKAKRLSAGLERTVDLLVAVSTAIVMWYGALLVLRGRITPGDLLVFLTYLKNSFRPVRDYAKYTSRLAKASAAGERILDLLEEEADIRDAPGAKPAPALGGAVRFEDVRFAYDGGEHGAVLDRFTLDVAPGERVAIIGPSGVGKSTITSLLLRLYDPAEGRVLFDGQDIRDFTIESLRGQIGIVPQDNLLFAASVHDNIAMAASGPVTREEVEKAARLANANAFVSALPDGYDTVLGERGATLSAGQRQRLAVARAALRNSPILILDEPTVGLDRENERAVAEALRRLAHGRTTFLITHDLDLASEADRIVLLSGGRVAETGTHAELMTAGGDYAALYGRRDLAMDAGTKTKGDPLYAVKA